MRRAHAGGGRASEFDPGVLRKDELDILRIMILSRDEQYFLDSAGHDEFAIAQRPEIAGVEKSIGGARSGSEFRSA